MPPALTALCRGCVGHATSLSTLRALPRGGVMRVNNIQVLRVAAAVGVVLYHLGCHGPTLVGVGSEALLHPLLAGFPVPLFFAVSGFVLAHAVRSTPPGRFLVARFLRLFPGYWLAVLGAVALMRLGVYTEHHRWMIHFLDWKTLVLWPAGPGTTLYVLGIEWSLVYEAFLSVAVAVLSLAGPRRGLAVLAAAWLVAAAVKAAVWPGLHFDQFPHWSRIALSGFNVPFVMGVLTYQVKDRGRSLRWAVVAGVAALLWLASARPLAPETQWAVLGAAGAGAVWLAAQFPQLADRNRLVRLGDCTYGLFLIHVPLMLAVLYPAARWGWAGRAEVLWVAGAVAVGGGLVFGRVECAIHARLRPLAKSQGPDRLLGRLTARWTPWGKPRVSGP